MCFFNLVLLLSVAAMALASTASASKITIGVTCSAPSPVSGSVKLASEILAAKVVSMKIPAVRLLDPTEEMIGAFAKTNVSLFLSIPNTLVPHFGVSLASAKLWVSSNVYSVHRFTRISVISVGNDVMSNSPEVSPELLLRAMENLRRALVSHRILKISVSTTFSFMDIIPFAFPPSTAQFGEPEGEVFLSPILKFLRSTESSFLVSLYPHQEYESTFSVPIGFAIFEQSHFNYRDDRTSGIRYRNLFDMMVDAVISSLSAMGHNDLPVIVAETGWPSWGIDDQRLSILYLRRLLKHLKTPSPKTISELYISESYGKVDLYGMEAWGLVVGGDKAEELPKEEGKMIQSELWKEEAKEEEMTDDYTPGMWYYVIVTIVIGTIGVVFWYYWAGTNKFRRNNREVEAI